MGRRNADHVFLPYGHSRQKGAVFHKIASAPVNGEGPVQRKGFKAQLRQPVGRHIYGMPRRMTAAEPFHQFIGKFSHVLSSFGGFCVRANRCPALRSRVLYFFLVKETSRNPTAENVENVEKTACLWYNRVVLFRTLQEVLVFQILFVCHGNICRSPMAEFVLRDMIARRGLEAEATVESAATSTEEIGNPVHPGTREKLRQAGISCQGKRARQIRSEDYERFDWIVGMDDWNMRNLRRAFPGDPEGKLHKLLDFCGDGSDVADPWYTGDFDATWQDVQRGCRAMMKQIEKELKKE